MITISKQRPALPGRHLFCCRIFHDHIAQLGLVRLKEDLATQGNPTRFTAIEDIINNRGYDNNQQLNIIINGEILMGL
jgi:hypothetical protein